MKIALFIPEGVTQLVLTPETDHEKAVLNLLRSHSGSVQWFSGEFYECRGGWYRESPGYSSGYGSTQGKDLILRLNKPEPPRPSGEE